MTDFLFGRPKSEILDRTFSTDPFLFSMYPLLASDQSVNSVGITSLTYGGPPGGVETEPGPAPDTGSVGNYNPSTSGNSGTNSWEWPTINRVDDCRARSSYNGGGESSGKSECQVECFAKVQGEFLYIPYVYILSSSEEGIKEFEGPLQAVGTDLFIANKFITSFTYGVAVTIWSTSSNNYIKLTIPEISSSVEKDLLIESRSYGPIENEGSISEVRCRMRTDAFYS